MENWNSDILSDILKSPILIGIFIGWLLNSLSSYFKYRNERNRQLGKVIHRLVNIRDQMNVTVHHMNFFSNGLPGNYNLKDFKQFDTLRQQYFLPAIPKEVERTFLEDLAGFDPYNAYLLDYRLRHFPSMYQHQQEMLKRAIDTNDEKLYYTWYLNIETALYGMYIEVEETIYGLCWKFGFITYIKMRWKIVVGIQNEKPFRKVIAKHLRSLENK
jgi:hypothetical protein